MKTKTTFVILLGGLLHVNQRVRQACQFARIIAADSGIKHASSLNVVPELWVGDFDSTPAHLIEHYNHVEKLTFERQKDQTDGSLALQAALERGAKQIVLLGGLGGDRTDHMLALMFEMLRLYEAGTNIYLSSGEEECWPLIDGEMKLELLSGALFSILPLSDLKGLHIEGARYPLEDVDVAFGSSFTVSNVATGANVAASGDRGNAHVRISIASGRCVVICRPQDFSGI